MGLFVHSRLAPVGRDVRHGEHRLQVLWASIGLLQRRLRRRLFWLRRRLRCLLRRLLCWLRRRLLLLLRRLLWQRLLFLLLRRLLC